MKFRTGKMLLLSATIGLTVLITHTGRAQGEIINNVKEAIKTGSSKEIAKFLHQSVDVTLDGNMQSYSKIQTEYVLKDFFKNNPPSSFTIVHQGNSKSGLVYAIGEYLSMKNEYRVLIRIKKTNDKYLIHELSFIEE